MTRSSATDRGGLVIQGAIFDLGSTLIRFSGNWEQVIEDGFHRMVESLLESGLDLDANGFREIFKRAWQTTISQRDIDHVERPMTELLDQVLVEQGYSPTSNDAVNVAIERMFSTSEAFWHPMPGVHSMLNELNQAGLRLAIVSNASDSANVQRLVDSADLRSYFDPIVVSAEQRVRKPDERIFAPVFDTWSIDPKKLVMIGDNLAADIEGARRVGMYSIWLTADAYTPANRALQDETKPDAHANQLIDVPDVIRSLTNIEG
jgi:HAD superfamily hydrolase (TIGR01662 family)